MQDTATAKFYSTDGVACSQCWQNSEPLSEIDRSNCKCRAGYKADGSQSCVDIDECAADYHTSISAGGVCNTSTIDFELCFGFDQRTATEAQLAACGCCHQYSSGCVNFDGYFECSPCLSGFIGSRYGGRGCELPEPPPVIPVVGCDGILFVEGGKHLDACGVCDGDNSTCTDCAGTPNGAANVDRCGVCDADATNDCVRDCLGIWGGSATRDACGICEGDGSACVPDCAGVANGGSVTDECGNCVAPADKCTLDCAGVWGGQLLWMPVVCVGAVLVVSTAMESRTAKMWRIIAESASPGDDVHWQGVWGGSISFDVCCEEETGCAVRLFECQ